MTSQETPPPALPVQQEGHLSAPPAAAVTEAGLLPGSATVPLRPGERIRLLMIDDDREFCALIRDYLSVFGYEVIASHSGTAGLDTALRESWHAIILDVMLPGLSGHEVLRNLRRQSNVPVLMLTARGDEADQIAGLEAGADDYLIKGSPIRQLVAGLQALMRHAAARAGGSPQL